MHPRKLLTAVSAALLLVSGAAPAHEDEGKGQVGRVSFTNSCDPKVQPLLETGVAMLHSFWYSAGEALFQEIAKKDPGCAPIANWGYASLLMNNPLAGQGALAANVPKAQAAIDQGRRVSPKTQRERDYIEAVAAYYEDWSNRPERARQQARARAFEELAARYPDDDEARIFSALYIAGTQSQADQTFAAYLKAAAILEAMFVKYPDHPGVAHYLIHSYDAPPIAQRGLPAARRYASLAPAAPHALHMPSHIFTRVGAWEDSAATNARSAEVARKSSDEPEVYHASDYMVYAYLQLSRDGDARRAMEDALKTPRTNPAQATPYSVAAMPARYAMERGAWREAMQLEPQPSRFPFTDAITHFARALGAARSGDIAAAEKDAGELARLHKALEDAKNNYWATEVEIQRLAAAGWIALAQGKADVALKFMRAAADLEDRNEKHIVTPGRIVPARELLGEMLLELKQPALALREFEASQAREPNRFRGYYGAARAAAAAGDRGKAADYYAKLTALAKNADSQRPELAQARAFVAQR